MRTLDLAPLHRFAVGFDHVGRLLDTAARIDEGTSTYPPYNIEKASDDAYRVTMAVAGFAEPDLSVTVDGNALVITGRHESKADEEGHEYLYRGIATRAFERRFQLADHIKVHGASLANGLLHIDLVRDIPEEKKARRIQITTTQAENRKAA